VNWRGTGAFHPDGRGLDRIGERFRQLAPAQGAAGFGRGIPATPPREITDFGGHRHSPIRTHRE